MLLTPTLPAGTQGDSGRRRTEPAPILWVATLLRQSRRASTGLGKFNGTVNVAAGTYAEEVTISEFAPVCWDRMRRSIPIPVRAWSEAVIQPDTNNPDIFNNFDAFNNGGVKDLFTFSRSVE